MKKILVILASLLSLSLIAQKKDKSGSFEEPMGWCKLIQLKNGNTCFLEFTKKEGIRSVLYDTIRKKIAGSSGKLPTKMIEDKLGFYALSGIYEINGDVTIFFQKTEERTPVMIRLVVDGKTGKLKSEEKIAELEKISMKEAYAMVFGGMDIPDLLIVKDPDSDYYALIRYNTIAAATEDRIEVLHFSPEHKLINRAKYKAPNDKFKYTRYLNGYVHKGDYVIIGTYAFNTEKSGGQEGRFYVSKLAKGSSNFVQKELPINEYYKHPFGEFVYNSIKDIVHMVLITDVDVKVKFFGETEYIYTVVFENIKPSSMSIEKPFSPDFSKVNAYYTSTMGKNEDYFGMVQGTFVDRNGNLVLMYQQTARKKSNGAITGTFLGDVALLTISPEGKTLNGAVFPYSSYVSGDHFIFNSNNFKTGYRPANNFDDKGLANEQYFGIDFVSTPTSNYLLFNNYPKNLELEEAKALKTVKAIGSATAVKYSYVGDAIKKDYLLKKPKEKNDVEFCLFGASSYNAAKRTYATIYTDPEKEKSAIVWIKLD